MNIIHNDLSNSSFSNKAEVATVWPIYKTKSRNKIENYRSVSILSCFYKVYEKFLLEKFKLFINTFLSKFIGGYRENYSSILIRLRQHWPICHPTTARRGWVKEMNKQVSYIQKQPPRGVLRKKVFWKYAANVQENTHAEVWFQQSCFPTLLKSHFGLVVLL